MVFTFFLRPKAQDASARDTEKRTIPTRRTLALLLFLNFLANSFSQAYATDFRQYSAFPPASDFSIQKNGQAKKTPNKELSQTISHQTIPEKRLLDQLTKAVQAQPDDGRNLSLIIYSKIVSDQRLLNQFGRKLRPDDERRNVQPDTRKQPSEPQSKRRPPPGRNPDQEYGIPDSSAGNWGFTVTHHGFSPSTDSSDYGARGVCDPDDSICQIFAKSFAASSYSKSEQAKVRQECEDFSQDDSLMKLVSTPPESFSDAPRQREKIISYYTKCFSVGLREKERQAIGIIIDIKDGGLIGVGTLLNDSTLITARHVLYRIAPNNEIIDQRDLKHIRFIPAANPNHQLKIVSTTPTLPKANNLSLLNQDEDIIQLTLKNPINFKVSKYPKIVSFPTTPVRLRLIGPSQAFSLADKNIERTPKPKSLENWTKYMVSDAKDACIAIHLKKNGCVQHLCSTMPGMSGAGIFIDRGTEGDLEMVAVHSGTPLRNSTCEARVQPPQSNVAIMVIKPSILAHELSLRELP